MKGSTTPLRRIGDRWYHGVAFFLPGFALYAAFILYPLAATVWYSLHRWNGFSPPEWFGLGNYVSLARDALFHRALQNNALLLGFYTVVPIVLGLAMAVLMTRFKIPGRGVYRLLLFLPQIMPMAVVGVVWRWMYNPVFGPINIALRSAGLGAYAKPWLGSFDWALPSIGLVISWVFYGFCMVVFVAGIQRINPELFEAARIDGANEWQQFWSITLPSLRREVVLVTLFTFIAGLKVFDLIFVTTRGGPGNTTLVASLYLYRKAFEQHEVGYAAAIAVSITLFVIMFSVMFRRLAEDGDN